MIEWLRDTPEEAFREIDGTLAFVDISGFTVLTERLARRGKVGAEELDDILNALFTQLLSVAYDHGAGVVKWGGDAVLLWFDGEGHAPRACCAAALMQRLIRTIGRVRTPSGLVTLRMSVGIHSGTFDFFLVGDLHRELIITGAAATTTTRMEAIASAGQVAVSPATAAGIDPRFVGAPKDGAFLLSGVPDVPPSPAMHQSDVMGVDLSRCLPLGVREYLLEGTGEPEHRAVAVGFVSFSGTDELLRRKGPGALSDALDECITGVQHAARRYEVTFFDTDIAPEGGKVLLVAGAPTSIANQEERMLRAARAIVERTGILPVRVGVNAGHVFAAEFGPPFRRTYTVKGDAVNLAARLMAKADPGDVLSTDEMLARSRTAFETRSLEPFHVKGKSRPVHASVVGPIVGARGTSHGATPMIGREAEMAALRGALDAVRRGEGRVVEIVGEPGIGKSRLVEELLATGGVAAVTVSCGEYESSTAYHPIRDLLRGLLGIGEAIDPEGLAALLYERIAPTAPELVPWLPLIGVPLDVEMRASPETASLDERFRKARVEQVTAGFLALIVPDPTVLVFDDVHWMDEASADLLRLLTSEIERRPWLVLTTRRDQGPGYLAPEGPFAVSLRPEPLGAREARSMLASSTEDDPLLPHEQAALVERAGGNPLFLKELLLAARSVGTIEGLPTSIEGLVGAQIDRLAPRDRTVLRFASVLGMSFEVDLLREIIDEEHLTGRTPLRTLADFLERDGSERLQFQHALIRDAAYEGLAFRRRRELHKRAGEAIERRAGERADEHAELLSLHFYNAQRFEEAWRYSRVAGERAGAKYANVEAADFYRRALDAAKRLPDVPPQDLAVVNEALGDARDRVGVFQEAAAAYRAARTLRHGDAVEEARLMLKEAWIPERLGRYPQALRLVTRAQGVLSGVAGPEAARERAELTAWYAAVRQAQGRSREAIRWSRQAIAEAERSGARSALANALYILDWAEVDTGEPGGEHAARALEIYRDLGDLGKQGLVFNYLGALAYFEGRWNEALDLYERAREARERTGDPVNAAEGTANIGEILSDQGHLREAEELLKGALDVLRAAGYHGTIAFVTGLLGRIAYRSDRLDEGLVLLRDAAERFAGAGSRGGALEMEARIAEWHLFAGDPGSALALADVALARAQAMGVVVLRPLLQRVRGYALMEMGRPQDARAALDESLRLARAGRADHEIAQTLEAFVHLDRTEDHTTSATVMAERDSIVERLGIVGSLSVPAPQGIGAPGAVAPPLTASRYAGRPR